MAFRIPLYGLGVDFITDSTTIDILVPINFTDLTIGATNWLWDFGDGTTSTLQNPTKTYTQVGDFTVSLIAWNDNIAGVKIKTDYITTESTFDPDALAFFNATEITDITQQIAVNDLVTSLKNENLWDKMQAIYPIVGGTANTHKYNLKVPRDLNEAHRLEYRGNAATHNANGITFPNGSYASTWCVPGTGVYDRSYGEYIRVINSPGGWSGLYIGNVLGFEISNEPRVIAVGVNNLAAINTPMNYGYLTTSVTSITSGDLFNNDSSIWPQNSPQNTPPQGVVYLGAMNTGTAGDDPPYEPSYSHRNIAFAHLGNGLTLTEHQALNTIVQAYQTDLGRNV